MGMLLLFFINLLALLASFGTCEATVDKAASMSLGYSQPSFLFSTFHIFTASYSDISIIIYFLYNFKNLKLYGSENNSSD